MQQRRAPVLKRQGRVTTAEETMGILMKACSYTPSGVLQPLIDRSLRDIVVVRLALTPWY